ncbi:hypothetical protein ACQEVZ_55930 [Dactylosporangium sp. CA-152071]|uniref:hypothetical protein n=1 Tax=Dactylosporangium sp. CA-152071 TaxID=3239933 RepID=UPI003D8B149D
MRALWAVVESSEHDAWVASGFLEVAVPSDFVMDSPQGLSHRATAFLAQHAARVEVDPGLTGDALRTALESVRGAVDEVLIQTLEGLQARYAGLTYPSRFFDSVVTFVPVCEPDPYEGEDEISYVVETGTDCGGSATRTGELVVSEGTASTIEFGSVDALIESDAMFEAAVHRSAYREVYANKRLAGPADIMGRVGSVRPVGPASGRWTQWLTDGTTDIFYCAIWYELTKMSLPYIKIWTDNPDVLQVFN